MKKMGIGTGIMFLLGFILILAGMVIKFKGINVLGPIGSSPVSYLVLAITCFLIGFILDQFDGSDDRE